MVAKKKKRKVVAKVLPTEPTKSFYIGVQNPDNMRRNILESSKDIIGILKQYQRIKQIREDKREAIDELNSAVKSIKSGLGKFKRILPIVQLRERPIEVRFEGVETEGMITEEPPKERSVPKKVLSEIEKLEAELRNVEGKLANI
jgi:hypothetical protein